MKIHVMSQVIMRAVVTFTALLLTSLPAQAAPGDAVTQDNLDARIQAATQALREQQTDAEYWEYGWGAFDVGTMLWSAAQARGDDNRIDRNTDIVEASESFIGLADVVLRPLPALHADEVCADPLLTRQDMLSCLSTAQALLKESAERAHEPYEVLPHLGNFGFNLLAGLIVWKTADGRHALITAVPGEAIGEMQIWTTPGKPMADWEHYQLRFGPLPVQPGNASLPAVGLTVAYHF